MSDDDAARTLIAWETAFHPRLDPTRSSWLPLHTFELAALLRAIGSVRWVPRILSAVGAFASALCAMGIAERFGATRVRALVAGLFLVTIPWVVFTAWAPGIPEMPCAAWLLGAVSCLVRSDSSEPSDPKTEVRSAALAGLFATIACGHRYEAWFATAAITVALFAMRRRREAIAFALCAAVFPLAWLAINASRSGDPLDFVHRVVRYRAAVDPNHSAWRDLARTLGAVSASAGIVIVAGGVALHRLDRRAVVIAAAGIGVAIGNVAIEWRGGGATHHAARTWLLVMCLAAPLAVLATSNARAFAVLAVAVFAQHVVGWRALPRDVSLDAVDAGRAARDALPRGECLGLETGRLDFLWVEYASERIDDVRADRLFAAPDADERRWEQITARCPVAITHSTSRAAWIASRGYRALGTHAPWTVWQRE